MRRILRLPIALGLCLAPMTLTGCGPGSTTVTGEISFGPEKVNPGDKFVILLNSPSVNYSGDAGDDGKFSIPNVQPGKYQVSYIHYVAAPAGPPKPGAAPPATSTPRVYPGDWTVPGGPYKLDLSKMKK